MNLARRDFIALHSAQRKDLGVDVGFVQMQHTSADALPEPDAVEGGAAAIGNKG
jgi:hypothetical protein